MGNALNLQREESTFTKICSKCNAEKSKNDFSDANFCKNSGWCRECTSSYRKNHYEQNQEETRTQQKEYYEDNRKKIIERSKLYNQKNRDKKIIYAQEWHQDNKQLLNERRKERRKIDPVFRLRQDISRLINIALSKLNKTKNGKSSFKYLQYTAQELKKHLEKQFEPWMNWGNQGVYIPEIWDDNNPITWTWQIDHIIPQSLLPYTSMEDENFKKCWALENLRPLSAKQNILDGVKRTRHIREDK